MGLIDLIPLIQGDLVNNRRELHELLVRSSLSTKRENTIIDVEDIKKDIVEIFKFRNFPNELLTNILEDLEKANYLKSVERGKYEILKKFEQQSISSLITDCYKEFVNELKKEFKEFDPYIHKNFEYAFRDCLFKIVDAFLDQGDFYKNQIETFNQHLIEEALIEKVENHGIASPKQFISLFFNYLNSGRVNITNFIFFSYKGAITYDLLRRGSILSKETCDIGKGGLLLLDTNIIISLICDTDRTHRLSSSAIKLSKNLKFDVCFTTRTEAEFDRLLKAADSDMKVRGFFKDHTFIDNQLIQDYINKKKGSWGDYYTLIANIELFLKSKYDIDIIKFDKDELIPNDEIMEYIDSIYPTVLQLHSKERFKEALEHDLYLLGIATSLRKARSNQAFDCPWILSFDKELNFVNRLTIDRFKLPYGYTLHPRHWLNTLLVFSNVEIDESNKEEIVKSIMYHMIFPTKNILSLDQYAKLVTDKLGLTEKDVELIERIFTLSPLRRSLEDALKSEDVEHAVKITSEILTDSDLIDKAISVGKTKEENTRLREQLKNIGENLRIERAKSYLLEETLIKPTFIQNITIENANPNTTKMVETLINRIEQLDPEFFKKTGIQKISGDNISKETTISTLQKIKTAVNKSKEFVQDIRDLTQHIPAIIAMLKQISP